MTPAAATINEKCEFLAPYLLCLKIYVAIVLPASHEFHEKSNFGIKN